MHVSERGWLLVETFTYTVWDNRTGLWTSGADVASPSAANVDEEPRNPPPKVLDWLVGGDGGQNTPPHLASHAGSET